MPIRYDKNLNKEIARVVKNFNQKISRLEKQNREMLPQKVTVKEIKQGLTNKRDLNVRLRELRQFSQKGQENIITTSGGVTLSRYELTKLRNMQKRLKSRTYRQLKSREITKPTILGKEQARTFAEMGDDYYSKLLGRKQKLSRNISKLSPEELQDYINFLNRNTFNYSTKQQIFMENYFDMLSDLAYYIDYDAGKIEKLKDKLMRLRPDIFYKLFDREQAIKSILYYYTDQAKLTINPEYIKDDVTMLYDNLIDNIDEIIKQYA